MDSILFGLFLLMVLGLGIVAFLLWRVVRLSTGIGLLRETVPQQPQKKKPQQVVLIPQGTSPLFKIDCDVVCPKCAGSWMDREWYIHGVPHYHCHDCQHRFADKREDGEYEERTTGREVGRPPKKRHTPVAQESPDISPNGKKPVGAGRDGLATRMTSITGKIKASRGIQEEKTARNVKEGVQ